MFAIGHYITLKMDFFETPMIFANPVVFSWPTQHPPLESDTIFFWRSLFKSNRGLFTPFVSTAAHCAIRDVPHHPATSSGRCGANHWEVGKGYSREVRYDGFQEIFTYPTEREVWKIIDSKWTDIRGYVSSQGVDMVIFVKYSSRFCFLPGMFKGVFFLFGLIWVNI